MPAIGIDLGTTNTVVAAVRDGRALTLEDEDGHRLIPSVVAFVPKGGVLVGYPAKERRYNDPANTIYSVKRLIGRPWTSPEVKEARGRFPFELREGPKDTTMVIARGEEYALPEVSAFVLRRAKQIAEARLGEKVTKAVITVPANFNDLQRAATKVAGKLAGLEVLRILNEPTAAALAYGQSIAQTERIAVFDLGGGTFDITLLDLSGQVFEVLATGGDTLLGGDDIDALIAERMAAQFREIHRVDLQSSPEAFGKLRLVAEKVKIQLSTESEVTIPLNEIAYGEGGAALSLRFRMNRKELEHVCKALVDRTIEVCRGAIEGAKLKKEAFDRVILVGGSTRMPLVVRRVEEYFGKPPYLRVNPDEVVALGAAIQAFALDKETRKKAASMPPPSPGREEQTVTKQISPAKRLPDAPGPVPNVAPALTLPLSAITQPMAAPQISVPSPAPMRPRAATLSFEDDRSFDALANLPRAPSSQKMPVAPPPPAPAPAPKPAKPEERSPFATGDAGRAQGAVASANVDPPDLLALAVVAPAPSPAARRPSPLPAAPIPSARTRVASPAPPPPDLPREEKSLSFSLMPSSLDPQVPDLPSEPKAAPSAPPRGAEAWEMPSAPREPPRMPREPGMAEAGGAREPSLPAAPAQHAPAHSSPSSSSAPNAGPQADGGILTRAAPLLLIDVTPLSLCVETVGGWCDVLIPANSPVPCDRSRVFLTAADGQTTVCVNVAQGESRRFGENTFLGQLELPGLPPKPRGELKIRVTFEIDADGILNVRAQDLAMGRAVQARMRLLGASTGEEVSAMLARQGKVEVH